MPLPKETTSRSDPTGTEHTCSVYNSKLTRVRTICSVNKIALEQITITAIAMAI